MKKSKRPWGNYTVILEDTNFKLKLIEVEPGERLSYQFHNKRSEVWTIIEGMGEVIIDGDKINMKYGDSIKIKKNSKHRISNNSDNKLKFIEVQTGTYFGEDDIVRIEDDYNRIK
tara:strand:- start:1107 stop:1451 length:345 start_codon:yes stop_codon:yes gene_type:complete